MLQLQPRHWRSTLIVHALILLIAICVGGQSSSDPSKVSNFCTETWYVNKLITNLKERATTASNCAVEKNSQNAKLFQLAANRHANDKKGDGYAALAAMVEFENQKVAQQAVLFEQAHFDALHKLAHRAGAAALSIAISTTTKGQITGKGTVEANGGTTILAETDDKHCKVTQEVALATKLNCHEQKTNKVDATKEADKTATWDKILLRQRSELTKIAVDTRILVKGAGADIGGNPGALSNEPGCSDNSGHTTIAAATNAVVAGVKSFAATFKATPINLPATGEGREAPQAPNDGGDEIELLVPDEELEKALKTAFKQPIPVATDILTLKTTQVLSTPAVQAFAKELAAKNKGKATASLSDEDAAAVVFGGKKVDIQTTHIKHLEYDEITISSEPEIKGTTKKLRENNCADAMVYFYRENQKKLAASALAATPEGDGKTDTAEKAEEKKEGDNKATAADCKATEEGKCAKEKCTCNKEKKDAKSRRDMQLF